MTEHSKTYYTVAALGAELPNYPDDAKIVDRDGDRVDRDELHTLRGYYLPYTITWEDPEPISAKDVKAGDTVTVRIEKEYAPMEGREAYTITGKVYSWHGVSPKMIGPFVLDQDHITIISHEPAPEPEPKLPTANGSIVKRVKGRGGIFVPGEAHLIDGEWRYADGGNAQPDVWDGWELVRDAGEES